MIDSLPRPLHLRRLERLMRGLKQRFNSGAEKMSADIAALGEQLSQLEAEYQQAIERAETEFALQRDAGTTEWDEALHRRWDDAEHRSFKAVFETADKEINARRDAKRTIEYATTEAKKRIAEIEQRFLRAKDIPIKRLNAFRTSLAVIKEEEASIAHVADAALAQRSLRIPLGEIPEAKWMAPADSQTAVRLAREALQQARHHYQRLAEQPLGKFFNSARWWGICVLVFASVTAILALPGLLPALWAVLVALVVTVLVVLGGIVSIHPLLKRSAAAEYPRVRHHLTNCRRLVEAAQTLAVAENDAELKRLAAKRDHRFEQARDWRDNQAREITRKLETVMRQLREDAVEQKLLASHHLTSSIAETNQHFENRLNQELGQQQQFFESQRRDLEERRAKLKVAIDELSRGGALRLQIGTHKALHLISRSRRWCQVQFPAWERLHSEPELWPEALAEPILPIGNISLDGIIPDNFKMDIGSSHLIAPLSFVPLQDEYLTITGDPAQPAIQQLIRNLVMRALTTLPAGKTQVCVVDPPGLGRNFGWLMHLGDFDATLVTHRVWTQPTHIAQQLQSLALAAEDFIQQSLRNQYQNIVQYNRDAGALSEPFRLLVWSSMPSGLDDQSWKCLQSLLDTGARCGVIPILVIDPAIGWPSPAQAEFIKRRGMHLTLSEDGKTFHASVPTIRDLAIEPYPAAPQHQSQEIIQQVGRRALQSSRVEVPLEKMLPPVEDRWLGDSTHCLEIPIGQSGVGRTHSLKLGIGTAQHAIIAGKTGSGKSSLLHAMITSAVLKYSPDRLRLVLLDFKKGVEFQVYSDAAIPHADIIGIESQREFGLSALEYVDQCMQRRGEAFRQVGAQDLASWNVIHPDQAMPRMLVVIDEFQELFAEDDKLTGQAGLYLDRIVRQGRSFGIHAVLSSQTLSGSYSLPRTTLGQMAVRVALQCDPSDAQIIFTDDNPAAARLKVPGQAIYNDAGGRIEGNQPMQIGWLAKSQQLQWLEQLPAGYRNQDATTNRLGRTVVYDGNRAATWSQANAELAIAQACREVNPDAIWCVVGESVAISPAVAVPLTQQAGRNILVVGADDSQAAAVLHAICASFVRGSRVRQPQLFCIQGAKPTDAHALDLPRRWAELACELKSSDGRGADALLHEVYEMLQRRISAPETAEASRPVLLGLLQLGRLRSLRREDDFASFGESELTADKQLEEILRDGPSHGIFTMLWAESYSTVNRWLARSALREIEIRVVMQMSANDSTNLIDTVAASRLGEHVMLIFDEATGQEEKFRPYAFNSLGDMSSWVGGLDEN